MKILYIQPRFHTNQRDIVKGWIEEGNEVVFVSYYTAIIEDHSILEPIVLGYSPLYYPIDWIYTNVIKRNDPANTAFKINHGFPPIRKIKSILKNANPDIVIMRDRTLYSVVSYYYCKKYKYKSILYNQSPLWGNPPKTDFLHNLVRSNTPKYRMTPVMGEKKEGKIVEPNSYFVPFIAEPKLDPHNKQFFKNGNIEILSIGKYEPRKHHIMLSKVVSELKKELNINVHLTIIGEATGRLQKEHYKEIKKYIDDNRLGKLISTYTNVPRDNTDSFFANADIFVIPSTKENASISQIEAMSFSLPVICSDSNGSSCYIQNGYNGYKFRDCDENDLKDKLKKLLENKNLIISMGAKSYELINEKYSFKNYKTAVLNILSDMNGKDV